MPAVLRLVAARIPRIQTLPLTFCAATHQLSSAGHCVAARTRRAAVSSERGHRRPRWCITAGATPMALTPDMILSPISWSVAKIMASMMRLGTRQRRPLATLGTKRGAVLTPGGRISYHLSVKDLTGLTVSGSGEVTAPQITADSLSCDISGSGTITLGGTVPEQQLTISGSGSYEAGGLAGETLRADISGSGNAVVSVSDSVDVTISGSGSLTYTGDPTVQKNISGSGSVTKR